MLVLGIDTSLRSTGLGLVEFRDGSLSGVGYDTIKNPPKRPLSECLVNIRKTILAAIEEFKPDVVAIEGVFYAKFPNTTLILGEARGVAIAACAESGLQVFEHEPRRVKQAVAGWGNATKDQVQKMVVSLLGLQTTPPEDAADALAIAICHIQSFTRMALAGVKAL